MTEKSLAERVGAKVMQQHNDTLEFWEHWLTCKWCDPFGCGCCADRCNEVPHAWD